MQQLRRTTFFRRMYCPSRLLLRLCTGFPVQGFHLKVLITMRPGINSNDFGRFGNFFRRFEFGFCRRGNYISHFLFFVCSESIYIQCDFTCTCVVACFHEQMQTHNGKKRERESTSISIVVCVPDDS